MMKKFVGGFVMASLFAFNASAQDLESLLEGKSEESQVVASQQTRLSFAISTMLSSLTSEQRVFLRHVETQSWNKALLQWSAAFGGTSFEKTANATALQGLVQFKAGLEITGLETFFKVSEPKKVHTEILQTWRESVSENHPVWEMAQIRWNDSWTEIFGRGAEVRQMLRHLSLKADMAALKDLASKTPVNTRERALVDWQLALSHALNDQADQAAKILAQLLKNPKSPISADLVNLTAGRLLYQNGYFDAAIKYYEKLEKKSDYWLEAQEELAWSYLRKGEPQNALAISKTLVNPSFVGQVGAESYFVASLGQLKVCDYPQVMESLLAFPKIFRTRAVELNKLAAGEKAELVNATLEKMKTKTLSWKDLGKDAHSLPMKVHRDHQLIQHLKNQMAFEKEAQVAEKLYVESLAMTGLQGQFDSLKKAIQIRQANAASASVQRVQAMAKAEVAETKRILDKMHIVEAELIQQVDMATRLVDVKATAVDEKKGVTGSKRSDALVFPASKEVWFDELSNYRVDVKKGCQSLKR